MTAVEKRRSVPIMGYIGANGGGKSLAMILDTIPSLDAGRPVLSTVRLLDFRSPRPCDDDACSFDGHPDHGAAHPAWVPFTEWDQLLTMQHCDVLMDEITGIAGSRDTSALPSAVGDAFQQQRRADRVIRWSAPSYGRADVQLRETTQAITVCTGGFSVREPGRLWPRNRLFFWRTYDVRGVNRDAVQGLAVQGAGRSYTLGDVKPLVKQLKWGPGSEGFLAYDTFAPVLRVGKVTEAGRCVKCGGRRAAPQCSCLDMPRSVQRPSPSRAMRALTS